MKKNQLKNTLSIAFLIVGAVIGAGFASGREIRSFFAIYGIVAVWFIPLVFILLYFGCKVFFATGRLLQPESFSDISRRIFGRGAVFFDIVMAISNLVFIAGMLAGFDSLAVNLLGVKKSSPFISIFFLMLCSLLLTVGIKGFSRLNGILVVTIIVFLTLVCLFSINAENFSAIPEITGGNTGKLLFNSVLFAFSNLFSCAGVLYSSGKARDKKSLNGGSLIGALVLSVIMLLFVIAFLTASPHISYADMPVFYLAQTLGGLYQKLVVPVLAFSIFTTLLVNMLNLYEFMSVILKSKLLAVFAICVMSFSLRLLGFNVIVDYLYVYIGIFGAVYTVANIAYMAYYSRSGKSKKQVTYL